MVETDAQLVARIRKGDAAAFELLVRRHFRMAYVIAYSRLGNAADAEDVCQDALFRCWEKIEDCRDPDRVAAWMATIVRNHAHNRADSLRVRRVSPIEEASHVADASTSDAAVDQDDLRTRLEKALSRVSAVQREVVLLHDLEGLRHAEVADRLGISELMSRRHLSDARRALRKMLSDIPTLETDHD